MAEGAPLRALTVPPQPPETALVEATRRGLRRAPCLVSFSGGQDSSLVLAAATRLARRDGLPDPIPATWRIADAPRSHEQDWQESVVAELGLQDWVKLDATDELDWVGPVAAAVVQRHGSLYPANAHLHDPIAARACGGTVLTGIGGDQLFGLWRWSDAAAVLGRHRRATLRDLPRVGFAAAPAGLRGLLAARRAEPAVSEWLQAPVAAQLGRAMARERAQEPRTWPARVRWQAGRRFLHVGIDGLSRIGAAHDCVIAHPLIDPVVVDAVGRAGGRFGFASREQALAALFPGLRPRAVANRRTKAGFDKVFSRDASLAAAAAWDGTGVDPEIVDVEALRAVWSERVPIRSALLLQHLTLQRPSPPSAPR